MTEDMREILEIIDEMKRTVTATNASLERILDNRIPLDLTAEGEQIRQIKHRLDELADRVRLMSGGRVAYRTDELPQWLIDKIDES